MKAIRAIRENLYKSVKLIFDGISIFLFLPSLISGDSNLYTLSFIFLVDEVLASLFLKERKLSKILFIWEIVNVILGMLACALSFCLLVSEFYETIKVAVPYLNIGLYSVVVSFFLFSAAQVITYIVKYNWAENQIKKSEKKAKTYHET